MSTAETPAGAAGWPEALGSNPGPAAASSSRGARRVSDEQLARAAGRGDVEAFESLYGRYHLQLLSFSRHMVGRVHDAEDVVQHTFVAADRAFRSGKVPKAVRAWLYTVARNRSVSLLRARREECELPEAGLPSTENLAADVEQRADLRDLLADLRTLPDDQRAALLLSELGDLSHAEVAKVIGVRAAKVKALVFQARQSLMATADARLIACHSIREELAVATGAALRRRHLRNHLAQCEDCREFSARVRAQRASVAAILPVVPTVALRDSIFGALGGGGAAAAGSAGAGLGIVAVKSTAAKVLAIVAVGGATAGGGSVAISRLDAQPAGRPAERARQPLAAGPIAADPAAAADPRLSVLPRTGRERDPGAAAPDRVGTPAKRQAARGRDTPPGQAKPKDNASEPRGSRGQGAAKRQAHAKATPPGQAKRQGRVRTTAPGQVKPPAGAKPSPPGQAKQDVAPAPKLKAEPPAPNRAAPEPPVQVAAPAVPAPPDAHPDSGKAKG